jgi:hypothetical protein
MRHSKSDEQHGKVPVDGCRHRFLAQYPSYRSPRSIRPTSLRTCPNEHPARRLSPKLRAVFTAF